MTAQRTPEEIAREVVDALHCSPADGYDAVVAAALRSAVEAEREACAEVAEDDAATSRRRQWVNEAQRVGWEASALTGDAIGEAIRARGKA
jgi:hypothetical protein